MDRYETLAALVSDLGGSRKPGTDLDVRIEAFLRASGIPPDDGVHACPASSVTPRYTSVLDDAMLLVPEDWWWHLSHLEAKVVPTTGSPDLPVSDGADYRRGGRPVSYSCSLHGDRTLTALCVTTAALLARLAQVLKAKARAEGRMYRVQTGNGPMIADRDGSLIEMPEGSWLTDDGRLVPHREAFPQYDFLAPAGDDAPGLPPG